MNSKRHSALLLPFVCGLSEYAAIPAAGDKNPVETGLHFPPFGYLSKAALRQPGSYQYIDLDKGQSVT
jgi:hypothetical protein